MKNPASPTSHPLFVYGLLRRGMSAGLEGLVARSPTPDGTVTTGEITFVAEATLPGKLYDLGQYPGVVPARGGGEGPVVVGELWRVTDPAHWVLLDDFEGIGPEYPEPTLYRRVLAKAHLRSRGAERPSGETVDCWVYVYNRDLGAAPLVPSGDWAHR